jgi:WhiB family transcriptional regulator, redox-sensing transcriptional regulator
MQQRNPVSLLMRLADETHWRLAAACRFADPDLFFPISAAARNQAQVDEAKTVCADCPVRRECLHFAIRTQQMHGIWGGLTEEERYQALLAERRQGQSPSAAAQAR